MFQQLKVGDSVCRDGDYRSVAITGETRQCWILADGRKIYKNGSGRAGISDYEKRRFGKNDPWGGSKYLTAERGAALKTRQELNKKAEKLMFALGYVTHREGQHNPRRLELLPEIIAFCERHGIKAEGEI